MKVLVLSLLCVGTLAAPVPALAADATTLSLLSLDNLGWKRLDSYGPDNPWDSVPREMQKFGGIPFLLTTKMQFHGTGDARDNRYYPSHVTGLTVGHRVTRLHLIHGANLSDTVGKPLAAIRLNYADKHAYTLQIAYGIHTRDWWKHNDEKDESLSDTNSTVIWRGTSADAKKIDATHRLFKTTFELPASPHAVETIDIFSLFSRSSFVIVGLTVEGPESSAPEPAAQPTPAPQSAPAGDLVKLPGQIEVEVLALDGGLLDGARLKGAALDDRGVSTLLGRMDDTRGDAGIVVVDFPAHARSLRLTASTRNRGPATFEVKAGPDGKFPAKTAVRLGMSKRIVGTVLKPDGQPLSKAKVTILERTRSATGAISEITMDELTTDSQGQWKAQITAETATNLVFRVTHVDYWLTRFTVSDKPGKETVALGELLAGEAQLRITPKMSITGVVRDSSGKPLPQSRVQLAYGGTTSSMLTDSKGHFNMGRRDPGDVTLIVQQSGFAPFMRDLTIEDKSLTVDVTLQSGTPFAGRVVEWRANATETKPLEGAKVVVTLPTAQTILWSGTTEAAGRFVWDNAPAGPLRIQVSYAGYLQRTFNVTRNDPVHTNTVQNTEIEYSLSKTFGASGTVVDAKTKQPIAEFTITPGFRSSTTRFYWNTPQATKGSNGAFVYNMNSGSSYSPNQLLLKVETAGYEPQLFLGDQFGWRSNRVELRPAVDARFQVKLPDGKPASNAYVATIGEGSITLTADPRFGTRLLGASGLITKTDDAGQAQVAPHLSPRVVIVHTDGYVETTFSNLLAKAEVTLQAWGQIEGTVRTGALPAPGAEVRLTESHTIHDLLYTSGFQAKADDAGKFRFQFVPPGNRFLTRQFRSNAVSGYQTMVKVEPGKIANPILGGTGRPVIGRVVPDNPSRAINWTGGSQRLATAPTRTPTFRLPEDYQTWFNSPEATAARESIISYPVIFANDGSFRAEDVPAGRYQLHLNFYEPRQGTGAPLGPTAGFLTHEFEVEPIAGGRSDDPLDLGTLELKTRRVLEAGR